MGSQFYSHGLFEMDDGANTSGSYRDSTGVIAYQGLR